MSTMPLLPPDRSHICMAFASLLWAHAAAGAGVAGAAAALAEAEAAGAEAAGAEAAGGADAAGAPVGAADDDPELQAAATRMVTIARQGSLRRLLIQTSS